MSETENPDFDFVVDSHGSELHDSEAELGILGGDYCHAGESDRNPYEMVSDIDSAVKQASNTYEEVKVMDGNHEDQFAHSVEQLEEHFEEEELEADSIYQELTGEEGKDPEGAETLTDLVVANYDNVEKVEQESFDYKDHTFVVGGSHLNPEIDPEIYEMLEEDPGKEELGYGEDKLEEVADELEEEPEYGLLGNLPFIGKYFRKIGEAIGVYGKEEVNPEEIDLEEIPEELRTEEHENYISQIEEIEEEYSEQIEKMNEKKEKLEQQIKSAENPVIAVDHGIPIMDEAGNELDYGQGEHKGSIVWKELLQENDVEAFFGGHFHSEMDEEVYGTRLLNPGQGRFEVEMYGGLEIERYGFESEQAPTGASEEQEPEEGNDIEDINEQLAEIDEAGGPKEYFPDPEEILGEDPSEQQEAIAGIIEKQTAQMSQAYDHYQEEGEFDTIEEFEEVLGNMPEPATPQTPDSPETPGSSEAEEATA
jgi:hypothetical protein